MKGLTTQKELNDQRFRKEMVDRVEVVMIYTILTGALLLPQQEEEIWVQESL